MKNRPPTPPFVSVFFTTPIDFFGNRVLQKLVIWLLPNVLLISEQFKVKAKWKHKKQTNGKYLRPRRRNRIAFRDAFPFFLGSFIDHLPSEVTHLNKFRALQFIKTIEITFWFSRSSLTACRSAGGLRISSRLHSSFFTSFSTGTISTWTCRTVDFLAIVTNIKYYHVEIMSKYCLGSLTRFSWHMGVEQEETELLYSFPKLKRQF